MGVSGLGIMILGSYPRDERSSRRRIIPWSVILCFVKVEKGGYVMLLHGEGFCLHLLVENKTDGRWVRRVEITGESLTEGENETISSEDRIVRPPSYASDGAGIV